MAKALGRPRALAFVLGWRVLAAWVIASPLARTLSVGARNHPRGDAVLFDEGGLELAEAIRAVYPVLGSELEGATLIGAVLAFASLVPLGVLLHALNERGPRGLSRWVARAMDDLPRMTLLGGATLLVRAVLVVLTGVGIAALRRRFAYAPDGRLVDLWTLGIALCALALWGLCSALQDLARARIVAARATLRQALCRAAWTLARRPGAVATGYLGSLAMSLVVLGASAWLVGKLDVSQASSLRVAVVAIVHQTSVLLMIVARAGWLARALELSELSREPRESADRSGDSDARADPNPDPVA
jgi:hypothetical protein